MKEIELLVNHLGLQPHVEGGYFKETFRSSEIIETGNKGSRNLATLIYFLLPSGQFSRFHRIASDEIWIYQSGAPLKLHTIDAEGKPNTSILGPDVKAGEELQIIIPANTIFGAEVGAENSFTLAACMVAPGFDFLDFELLSKANLLEKYPSCEAIIQRLHQFEE